MKLQFELIEETFIGQKSHEEAKGITVIIDREFRDIIDTLIKMEQSYDRYSSVITDALIRGNKGNADKTYELLICEEELFQEQTDQKVKGVRIMIIGGFKDMLDKQVASGEYKSYSDCISAKLKIGINDIINECKERYLNHE